MHWLVHRIPRRSLIQTLARPIPAKLLHLVLFYTIAHSLNFKTHHSLQYRQFFCGSFAVQSTYMIMSRISVLAPEVLLPTDRSPFHSRFRSSWDSYSVSRDPDGQKGISDQKSRQAARLCLGYNMGRFGDSDENNALLRN